MFLTRYSIPLSEESGVSIPVSVCGRCAPLLGLGGLCQHNFRHNMIHICSIGAYASIIQCLVSRIVWSAIMFQAKSDLVGTFSVLRRIVGSAAVPLAYYPGLC